MFASLILVSFDSATFFGRFVSTILSLWKKLTRKSLKSFILETKKKYFFSIWVFSHDHSRITGLQGKGKGISLTPHYHFHPLHRHLDISRAITAESSPLHIGSSRARTSNRGNVLNWFKAALQIGNSTLKLKAKKLTT